MKILFSCIGDTDPINVKNDHDGPMLHIVRNLEPEIVYLYLSKDMVQRHRDMNLYERYIKKLSDILNKSIKVEVIEREDLENVHIFDQFYEDFRSILENIHYKYPESEILLNVSSETPAMKSSLQVLASFMSFPIALCQVSTPKKGTHESPLNMTIEDWDIAWEMNIDNENNSKRISKSKNINLNFEINVNLIKNFINEDNYNAAYEIAKNIKDLLDQDAIDLILFQKHRKNLEIDKAKKACKNLDLNSLFLIKNNEISKIYEYYLVWQSNENNGDYSSFIIGLTPLIAALQKKYLEKYVDGQSRISNNARWENKPFAMSLEELARKHNISKEKGPILSYQYNELIEKCKDIPDEFKRDLRLLRAVENDVRNIQAHQITAISKDIIKKKIGSIDTKAKGLKVDKNTLSIDDVKDSAWNLISNLDNTLNSKNVDFRRAYSIINREIIDSLTYRE